MSWRDHVVMLLMSGAQVEHALMVQYLYAAYSIDGENLSKERQAMVEGWRASILSVAREEMGHLLTVQNMLVLLGAPVSFDRQMTPWDHKYYPFPFSLEPFSMDTLRCFIYAEMPQLASLETTPPGKRREKHVRLFLPPERQQTIAEEHKAIMLEVKQELAKRFGEASIAADLHQVGELYDEIIELISDPTKIPDTKFNEASYDVQASWDDWGRGYKPDPHPLTPEGDLDKLGVVRPEPAPPYHDALARRAAHVQIDRAATRAQAVKALRALAAQGEAQHLKEDETGEPSHFERFAHIYKEYKELLASEPGWKASRAIANPTTREDFARHNPNATYLNIHGAVAAHHFAQLFNQRYRMLLNYLAHSFQLARTQPNLRAMVMHRAFGEMYNLKTIAGLLVRLPLGAAHRADVRAAPPFEMPYSLELPGADREIWRQHDDLLAASQKTCNDVFYIETTDVDLSEEITRIGGDVYLNTLMNLDNEARRWIGRILTGEN